MAITVVNMRCATHLIPVSGHHPLTLPHQKNRAFGTSYNPFGHASYKMTQ